MRFPSLDGLLGLTWKDEWQHGSIYFEKDAVLFEGSVYVAINDNQNVIPTDTDSWSLFSKYLAIAGSLEDVGETLPLNLPSESPVLVTQPVAFTSPPPLSEWTILNQGGMTATDVPGGIRLIVPPDDTTNILRALSIALPAPPYTITMFFKVTSNLSVGSYEGEGVYLGLMDSGSGSIQAFNWFDLGYQTSLSVVDFSDLNTFDDRADTNFIFLVRPGEYYLRVSDDGTNRTWSFSSDGDYFSPFWTSLNTDYITPDTALIEVTNPDNAAPDGVSIALDILHWSVT